MYKPKPKWPQRSAADALLCLCLSFFLMSCSQTPALPVEYVATPVTANLDLLCKPVVRLPDESMRRMTLSDYALAVQAYAMQLQDDIKECAAQQDEYRAEIDRLVKRAKTRASP